MGVLTLEQLRQWQPGELQALGDTLRSDGRDFEAEVHAGMSKVRSTEGDWIGRAGDAARARAARESIAATNAAEAVSAAADVMITGGATLAAAKNRVLDLIDSIERKTNCTVSADGQVTARPAAATGTGSTSQASHAQLQAEAEQYAKEISDALKQAAQHDANVASDITKALEAIQQQADRPDFSELCTPGPGTSADTTGTPPPSPPSLLDDPLGWAKAHATQLIHKAETTAGSKALNKFMKKTIGKSLGGLLNDTFDNASIWSDVAHVSASVPVIGAVVSGVVAGGQQYVDDHGKGYSLPDEISRVAVKTILTGAGSGAGQVVGGIAGGAGGAADPTVAGDVATVPVGVTAGMFVGGSLGGTAGGDLADQINNHLLNHH